jgi:predicted secreted protein
VLLQPEGTPSTGYRWAIEISPSCAIGILQSRWAALAGAGVGAAGKREFTLRIERYGEIPLQAELWRKCQGEGSVAQREEFIRRVP